MLHCLWKPFEKHFKFSVILQSRDPLSANDFKFTEILFKIFAIVQTLEALESTSDSQECGSASWFEVLCRRTSHRNAMYSNRFLSYTIQSSTVNSIWVHTNTFHRNTAGCSLRIHSKARGFVKHMCSKCANCFSMLMEFHKKGE